MTQGGARNPGTLAAFLLALVVFPAVALLASRTKSSTFDEPIHLPPGYVSLTTGDHRMNPDHPPLVRRLSALPLLFLDVKWDREDFAWRTGRPWEFGKRFLYRWNDAERLLFWGRLPVLALGSVLLLVLFFFVRRNYGQAAALVAIFLAALHPDFLAHGAIVSTDLGITVFVFATAVAFSRVVERITPGRVALAGALLGAACATKFSGVGLIPMLALPALAAALDRAPLLVRTGFGRAGGEPTGDRELRSRGEKLLAVALVFVAMGIVAVPVIWAAYGFHSPLAVDPDANVRLFDWRTVEPENPAVRALFSVLRQVGVLPEAWIWGFLHFLAHTEGRPAFLFGAYSESGFRSYFLATFLLKTPLPLLLLFAAGIWSARRSAASSRMEWLVFFPPGLFFALSLLQSINIGHRHLLPIYPFVFVIAARAAALALGPRLSSRRAIALAVTLVLAQGLVAGRAFPHYLAYFNEVGGGPRNGWRYLVDSNLDWGQELKGLRAWMTRTGQSQVKLAYFGTADAKYYGVTGPRLPGYQAAPPGATVRRVEPGDVVAVSATLLQGLYLETEMRPLMERLRAERPLEVIGDSLFLYRVGFLWEAAPPATTGAETGEDP